jgi:hypothetical protein
MFICSLLSAANVVSDKYLSLNVFIWNVWARSTDRGSASLIWVFYIKHITFWYSNEHTNIFSPLNKQIRFIHLSSRILLIKMIYMYMTVYFCHITKKSIEFHFLGSSAKITDYTTLCYPFTMQFYNNLIRFQTYPLYFNYFYYLLSIFASLILNMF